MTSYLGLEQRWKYVDVLRAKRSAPAYNDFLVSSSRIHARLIGH